MICSIFLQGISCVVFAGLLGIVTATFTARFHESQQRRQAMVRLAKYMKFRAMPMRLKRNLRHYLLFVWEHCEDNEVYEEHLLSKLSPALKGEICDHIYGSVLRNAPFLAWMT